MRRSVLAHLSDGSLAYLAVLATAVLCYLALGVVLPILAPYLASRGDVDPVVVGLVVGAPALSAVTEAPSALLVVASAVVLSAGQALAVPALGLVALRRVPAERHGTAAGLFFAFFDLGVGLGGPAVGAMAHVGGGPAAALDGAAVAVGLVAFAGLAAAGVGRRAGGDTGRNAGGDTGRNAGGDADDAATAGPRPVMASAAATHTVSAAARHPASRSGDARGPAAGHGPGRRD